jgi:membrane protease YdiL (CAAX protease family)
MTETNVQRQAGLFVVFLLCGLAVFAFPIALASRMSPRDAGTARAVTSVVFLVAAVAAYQFPRLKKHWLVLFAFFTASLCLLMASQWGAYGMRIFSMTARTPGAAAVAKLSEAVVVLFFVLILTTMIRSDLASIYLQRGDLKRGLTIGGVTFVSLSIVGCAWAVSKGVSAAKLVSWAPWVLVFVLAKGFMEELLFRGLFLRRLEPFLGARPSNVLTAIVFALAQAKAAHVSNVPIFVAISLVLGLGWGYVMQKTDSVIGPTLFHAGADVVMVLGMFAAL